MLLNVFFHASAAAILLARPSDKTYLRLSPLTYRGFGQASVTGSNWCQREAKRQWFIARHIWLERGRRRDYLFPLNSHIHCVLFRRPPPPPPCTHTHPRARISLHPPHTPPHPLQALFMSEWLGLCVCGPPCPLKRALINDYFINQEVLAGLKRLWGQGSAEVLNQFPIPGRLDIFCFLAARRFIIILPRRRNGRGMAGGLDVGGKRGRGGGRQ